MGMDTVELVMEVEEAFDITIPDADAERILTVGNLYHYILSRLHGDGPGTGHCLTAATFYRLRRALMRSFRTPRCAIRPDSSMDSLMPARGRRAGWKRLGATLGWELPALVRPAWVGEAYVVSLVLGLGIVGLSWVRLADSHIGAVLPLIGVFAIGALLWGFLVLELTRPLAVHVAPATVRELIPRILITNFGRISGENPGGGSRSDVWDTLVAIIAEQMGVDAGQIIESTRFVEDLGMD
jgi:acyl carrier protein